MQLRRGLFLACSAIICENPRPTDNRSALARKGTDTMADKHLYRELLEAVFQFDKLRLWERFSNFDYFAAKVPGAAEPMFGVVMGQAGEEFGLSVHKGPEALKHLCRLLEASGPGDDDFEDADYMSFSMEHFRSLPPEGKAIVRAGGYKAHASRRAPLFLAKPPRRHPRTPNDDELRQLLYLIHGVVQAHRHGDFNPTDARPEDGVLTLHVTGDMDAPAVTAEVTAYQAHEQPRTSSFPTAGADLRGLHHLDATWMVGFPTAPGTVDGDDRTVRMLLVADDASEFLLDMQPIMGGATDEAADVLVGVFHGDNAGKLKGLPRRILFSSRNLHDALAPALRDAGVECAYLPTIPKLGKIVDKVFEFLDEGGPPLPEHLGVSEESPLPAPDDLAGWKAADQAVMRRLMDSFNKGDRSWWRRAAKRYFGDEDAEYFLTEYEEQGAMGAYVEWAFIDYRPTRRSKTLLEKMLAKGLPEVERVLIEARRQSYPSLRRVESHDPRAGTVTLEDVLLGDRVTVHDRLLSENIDNGVFLAVRVFQAGRFHFAVLAGPVLGPHMGMEAAELLHDNGLEFTPEGLRRDSDKFGRLWDWLDNWQANRTPPRLCNTDGEDLVWHTASFGSGDEREVRNALLRRKDVEYDADEDEFSWIRDTTDDPKVMGDLLRLGRIEFIADELILTVNSAERLGGARKWLEKLPGVRFRGVTTRRVDEPDEDRPMDEKVSQPEPVEMTPEFTSAVQDTMDRHYMAWLDGPLPALGGRSPRQACRTSAGRQKVAMMIRTIPQPMGPGPVHVPRQAMLRKLGLKTEPRGSEPADDEPPGANMSLSAAGGTGVSSSDKIGRNDPCPCGSGKKYKKCCGR